MAKENNGQQQNGGGSRFEMLKAFDETNAGVKGLADSGLQKLPAIFVRSSDELAGEQPRKEKAETINLVPVIDISGIQTPEGRKRVVEKVASASETWGFFQVVNHGISSTVTDRMIDGVRRFNEQDVEEKKKYYTRDTNRKVRFSANFDLFTSRAANWKDTLSLNFSGDVPTDQETQDLPPSCRESSVEYSKHVAILGNTLLALLSEGLGLQTDSLKNMDCSKGHRLHCHYHPACPEPELTIGTVRHFDPVFLTILLQSQDISALQVVYEGGWVDIHPTPGGLVVNIGDLLQLVSNGRFKSIEHRALANNVGPRISVACFFAGPPVNMGTTTYGPIKELISKENPIAYKEVGLAEYASKFFSSGLDVCRVLDYYKV